MLHKIAVIAGTPVDTRMGVDFLNSKNTDFDVLYCPLKKEPRECHIYQMLPENERYEIMKEHFKKAISDGADAFFIYCNSLSATVDFKSLAKELGVICITTLDAYEKIAAKYNCCGLIAANNQATCGIEKTLTSVNPQCYVMGTGMLMLVEDIEKGFNKVPGFSAEEITEKRQLSQLCDFYKKNGAQTLILGCTHFPFIKTALGKITDIQITDPADIMFELISDACRS